MITGKDIAKRDKKASYRDWIVALSAVMGAKLETPFTGKISNKGTHAIARIENNRLIADCPDCAGAEYVDPGEPLFYCFSCGNKSLDGDGRKVIIPDEVKREL